MKLNKMIALMLALVTVFTASTVSATSPSEETESAISPVQPYATFVDCNYQSNEAFVEPVVLNAKNGDILNFYVNNFGTTSVTISIEVGGQKVATKTYAPGNGGHISTTITNGLLGGSKTYTLKCTAPNGAYMDVYLKAAQRHSE